MLFVYAIILGVLSTALATPAPIKPREIPEPVSIQKAKDFLENFTVAEEINDPAYSRALFPTWITIANRCNTRQFVLIRDGTNVVTNSSTCAILSGTWVSPYDDIKTTVASNVDIDHLVPLKEAWVSGARDWTTDQRKAFANDVIRPQLVAVSSSSNRSKGDKDVTKWVPPLESFRCTYVRAWITVKQYYNLTVDYDEKNALSYYLDTTC